MDQSIQYNLRNPAFLDDIGYSMIDKQFPVIDPNILGANPINSPNVKINNGQPAQDEFNNSDKKSKSKGIFKKAIIIGAIIGLGILGIKKGKSILKSCKNFITKAIQKFKK